MNPANASSTLHRVAGLLLLVVFGAVQMHLAPLFAAVLACADGGHEVKLAIGRDGARLVLHHPAGTVSGHRHHGPMILLAGRDDGHFHSDHQLLFASARLLEKEKDITRLVAAPEFSDTDEAAVLAGTPTPAYRVERRPGSLHQQRQWWPPSPVHGAWGSVVLLM